MTQIAVIGAGNVGRTIARDLAEDFELIIVDSDRKKLDSVENRSSMVETVQLDASSKKELEDLLSEYDTAVGALPSALGYDCVKAAIEAETDIIDISFMPEDPFSLEGSAKRKEVTVIVDAGFGPGMSNVFMGRIDEEMDELKKTDIKIGGLPLNPEPPLYYELTWSPKDLIEEYLRKARIRRDGEVVEIDPFDEIREVELHGKKFEEFYSDGLRTLLETIDVDDLEETTLRWKGHLEKMKVLRELGFFDEENIDHSLNVIESSMRSGGRDFCIMDVRARGEKDGKEVKMEYFFYDEAGEEFSAMSRSTGYPAAAITRLFMQKKDEFSTGVIPPEIIGRDKVNHDYLVERLREKEIKIKTPWD